MNQLLIKLFDFSSWGTNEWIAQAFGLLALISYITSYLQKKTQVILWLQLMGSFFWFMDFVFLGAPAGMMLNGIGIVRGIIYLFKEKHAWARHWCWYVVFISLFIAAGFIAYFIGEKWLAIFPCLALVLTTISLAMKDPFKIRIFAIITCPLWVVYEVLNMNFAGLLNEAISLASALIGIFTIDVPAKRKK